MTQFANMSLMRKILQYLYYIVIPTGGAFLFYKGIIALSSYMNGKDGETLYHFDLFIVMAMAFAIWIGLTAIYFEAQLFPKWWTESVKEMASQGKDVQLMRRFIGYSSMAVLAVLLFFGSTGFNNYIRVSESSISASTFSFFNNEKTYDYSQVHISSKLDRNGDLRTRFVFFDGKDIGSIENDRELVKFIIDQQSNQKIKGD